MTQTFYQVADDFTGVINIAGQPKAYTAGEMIVLDSDSAEERSLVDLGLGNSLDNLHKRQAALDALVDDGVLIPGGSVGDAPSSGATTSWTIPLDLENVASGEVARFKPGYAGRIIGMSAIATEDATTASKAASLGLGIDGDDQADEIQLLTMGGAPAGGNFDAAIQGVDVLAVAYNSTVNAFQAKVDATSLAGKILIGGSAGAWTVAGVGDLADTDLTTIVITGHLTGGTAPAVTVSTTVPGGGVRLVGASGNPATLDLTSSNVTDGGVVAGETIATGSNAKHGNFGADDEIVLSASGVTAFVEGAVVVTVYLRAN